MIKNIVIYALITIIVIVTVLSIPLKLKMELIDEKTTNEKQSGNWWFIVFNKDEEILKDYEIDLSNIDFNKNYVVLSGGRRIDRLIYRYSNIFSDPYFTFKPIAIFNNKYEPNIIFIYKTEKKDCYWEE